LLRTCDRNPPKIREAGSQRPVAKNSKKKEGAHLKPGVKKPMREMSAEEMRRKGSWAVRFYGRSESLPPLRDKHGKPTRFALTAAAWGEAVPRTSTSARQIAQKGRRLVAAAQRKQNQTT